MFSNTVTKTYILGVLKHSDSDGGAEEPGRGILLVYDLYQDVDSGHQLNSRTRPRRVVLQFKLTLDSLHQTTSVFPTIQTYIRQFTLDMNSLLSKRCVLPNALTIKGWMKHTFYLLISSVCQLRTYSGLDCHSVAFLHLIVQWFSKEHKPSVVTLRVLSCVHTKSFTGFLGLNSTLHDTNTHTL